MAIDLMAIQPHKVSRDLSGYVTYLYGPAKSGKAQPVNTVVPTPTGDRLLGSIKPGDELYDRFGKPTKVLEVFPQGKLDNYKVTFSDGRYTYCNNQHLWTYYTSRGNLKTVTLQEMIDHGLYEYKGGTSKFYKIPTLTAPVKTAFHGPEVDPYIIGAFLGDGCCKERVLTFSSNDEELVAEIAKLLKTDLYKKSSEYNYSWIFPLSDNMQHQNEQGNSLITLWQTKDIFKNELACVCNGAENKRLPEDCYYWNAQDRYALLQGLLDTDGSIGSTDYKVIFTTISIALAYGVIKLANSLGYKATLYSDNRTDKYKTGICYTVSILCDNKEKYKLFRLSRKQEIAIKAASKTQHRLYDRLEVVSIEKMPEQAEMVCVLVDNDEHLYLTNDYIVTHNTTLATRAGGALLLAFEKGYGALPGVFPVDIASWGDIKSVCRELKKPEVKEKFKVIIFDTIDIAGEMVEKYVCSQNGVTKISEAAAYGQGWNLMKREFSETVRAMTSLGYAVFFISHDKDKEFTRKDGTKFNQTIPSCANTFNNIAKDLADIYAYTEKYEDNGKAKVKLILRSIDNSVDTGCRFKYMEPECEMSYEALVQAVQNAIDKEAAELDNKFVTNERETIDIVQNYDYAVEMETCRNSVQQLMTADQEKFGPLISQIITKYLGKGKKVSEATIDQVELIHLINEEIKEDLLPQLK